MVECKDCRHFRRYPGDTPWKRKTGCYHPELMEQKQNDAFLKEQEVPGNHEKINLRGDCAKFEALAKRPSLVRRIASALRR
jgi:hypothetical protein